MSMLRSMHDVSLTIIVPNLILYPSIGNALSRLQMLCQNLHLLESKPKFHLIANILAIDKQHVTGCLGRFN